VLPSARDITLRTSDGLELGAWYVQASGIDTGVTVLVAPGNAGHRADRAPLAEALAAQGLSVLLIDYRGYGGNPGGPSEAGLARDVRAAHRFCVQDLGAPPERLVYLGESLGAAAVTELATEHPPAGLVLRSPFESLEQMARVHYPLVPAGFLRDELDVSRHVAQVDSPTVVVLGSQDSVVPPEQSRAVAETAPRLHRLVVVPGADHNDPVLVHGPALVAAVSELAHGVSASGP
jgi:pimeloyl-ACP methyl ester carboxylesterase